MLLIIDNYDSFTFNLVDYLSVLGAEPQVRRNDAVTVDDALALAPRAILLSPGPGGPADSGICPAIVEACSVHEIPLLGVCLGMQVIGAYYGARVIRAPAPMHGKISPIEHNRSGLFAGLPSPFDATRYHSLSLDPESIKAPLAITAATPDGIPMAISHSGKPIHGVQFHPESIASEHGHALLRRFLDQAGYPGKAAA